MITADEKRETLAEVRSRLASAARVVAFTGAGLCPDEAVPGFSDCGTRFGGRSAREIASPESFFEDPVAVWRWYDERRARLARQRPTAAHRALAALERRARRFTLLTESVDELHHLAGSACVIELRGSIWQVRCTRCGARTTNRDVPIPIPPSCPVCTGLVRPDIVWAGERIPEERLVRCFQALAGCDALIVAGSPGHLQPAASFIGVARKAGALIVETAPGPPQGRSTADVFLAGPAAEILPSLIDPGPGEGDACYRR